VPPALGVAAAVGWVGGEVGVRLRALIKEPSADTVHRIRSKVPRRDSSTPSSLVA